MRLNLRKELKLAQELLLLCQNALKMYLKLGHASELVRGVARLLRKALKAAVVEQQKLQQLVPLRFD